jgi:gamma-glutamylcysteine synthetase
LRCAALIEWQDELLYNALATGPGPRLAAAGMSEDGFLNPLRELVSRGYTRSEEMLKNYYGVWGKDLTPLFTEYNFL